MRESVRKLGKFVDPQKLASGRLQTHREWDDRVRLEEYYIFNVAIPVKWEKVVLPQLLVLLGTFRESLEQIRKNR